MLKQFIKVDSFFSLEELNRRIGKFDFGYYNDKNKPAPITEQKLSSNDNSLKQHGKFCWYCVFPFALSSVSDTILIEFLLIYMYYAGRLFCLHYFKLAYCHLLFSKNHLSNEKFCYSSIFFSYSCSDVVSCKPSTADYRWPDSWRQCKLAALLDIIGYYIYLLFPNFIEEPNSVSPSVNRRSPHWILQNLSCVFHNSQDAFYDPHAQYYVTVCIVYLVFVTNACFISIFKATD